MEAEKQWEMDGETQRNDKAKDPKEQNPISNTSNKCQTKKKKKKGRPEEENFSQETGLPDYSKATITHETSNKPFGEKSKEPFGHRTPATLCHSPRTCAAMQLCLGAANWTSTIPWQQMVDEPICGTLTQAVCDKRHSS